MPIVKGQRISMLYGTAWKKNQTAALVAHAIKAGFRCIDTAAQPKHYQEHLVGDGMREAIASGVTQRQELYIQTKYTPVSGQDLRNLPYDPKASIAQQVTQSVNSSLENLRHDDPSESEGGGAAAYLDCLVLHSPLPTLALTLEAWDAMSAFVPHRVHTLGISNVTLPVLEALHEHARLKPAVVQNRFHAATAYDAATRAFCRARGIEYQGFWTLTANPALVRSQLVGEVARAGGCAAEVAFYGLVQALGVVVLNGTSGHIESDLEGLRELEGWRGSGDNGALWSAYVDAFRRLVER
ncbi:hypothetical protein MBLNU459_g4889t1 [Dothideomycetes sp. NU459]